VTIRRDPVEPVGEDAPVQDREPVERQPDSGNVVQMPCPRCGRLTVLDPRRMTEDDPGVNLHCHQCVQAIPVRDTDPDRPVPDRIALLYAGTDPDDEQERPKWKWLRPRR